MYVSRVLGWILLAATWPTLAQTQWQVASTPPKSGLPPHMRSLAGLPEGSLVALTRASVKAQQTWRVPQADGSMLAVEHVSRVKHPNGDVTYSGVLQGGGAMTPVFVTEGRQAAFGQWQGPGGKYRMESWGDRAWLIRIDHADVVEQAPDEHALRAPAPSRRSSAVTTRVEAAPGPGAKAAPSAQIDVLFVVTPAFDARYPGSARETRVRHLVALANQLFANSAVSLGLRLVDIRSIEYSDATDNGVALADMRRVLANEGVVAGLGALRTWRMQTGADLVTLARPHDIETRGSCGIAYLFGDDARLGVNVLSDGVSSWSICSDETYAHEVGHNLGAEHQVGATSENAGFGTAHVVLGRFHTVMGSFGTGQPDRSLRLQRFSNPQQRCGGRPCGVADVADNARRLRDNLSAVAAYLPSQSAAPAAETPVPVDPDQDGDGVPESLDAFPHDPLHASDRDDDGVPDDEDAFPDDGTAWSDVDGDGIDDSRDADIDGDGIVNAVDALAFDATETTDADADGVGDVADAFDADRSEWSDLDRDGLGDNTDPDTDGDGVPDFSAAQDLLVASLGTDRVIRLDGDSGRFVAIEIAESHAPFALGPRSALGWNAYRRRTEALIASEVRRYDPFTRHREARVLRSFRGDGPGLRSGLSAAMTPAADGTVLVADGGTGTGSLHRFDPVDARELPGASFSDTSILRDLPRAMKAAADGTLWVLDRSLRLYEIGIADGVLRRELLPRPEALIAGVDPVALTIGPDAALYVADGRLHRVLRIDPVSGTTTEYVVGASGGLSRPQGLAFDTSGRLLVSSAGGAQVLRYAAGSGAFLDVFSETPVNALSEPGALQWVPRTGDRFPRDPDRSVKPRAGAWYDPARSGQGIDLQQIPGGLAFAWYTYEATGRATWYLAVGALEGDTMRAPLQRFTWDGSRANGTEVGEVTLSFDADDRATLDWRLEGRSGRWPLQHLQTGRSVETQFPTAVWYAPASPGWGFSITRQGDVLSIAAFVFDRMGQPSWALGVGAADAITLELRILEAPGACPGCVGNTAPIARTAGQVQIRFENDTLAKGDLHLVDEVHDWWFPTLALSRLSDTPTLANGDPRP